MSENKLQQISRVVAVSGKATLFSLSVFVTVSVCGYFYTKGLNAEGWRLTLEDFLTKQFPMLLFVHNDHYIVADSVCNDEIFIRDPALGRLKMNKKTLPSIWNGETLIFRNN